MFLYLIDINECEFESDEDQQCPISLYDCINTYGGFYCQCKNQIVCEDITYYMCPECVAATYCDYTTNFTCQCMDTLTISGEECSGAYTICYTSVKITS